jgi:hypothetical protein
MKVFISWSGPVSQQIAEVLRDWLPLILQQVKPFITTSDIDKGAKWLGEISAELNSSNYGIVCLTSENVDSTWLAFEAGALSKQLNGRVAPLLFDIGHAKVRAPLNIFQGTLFNRNDIRQFVGSMNAATGVDERRTDASIDILFEKLWDDLEKPIQLILETAAATREEPQQERNATDDALSEILTLIRQQTAILSSPDSFLTPVLKGIEALSSRDRDFAGFRTIRDLTAFDIETVSQLISAMRTSPEKPKKLPNKK